MREKEQTQIKKQARMVSIPTEQLCQICGRKHAAERHFITVPVPEAFTRICDKDLVPIKQEIRKRTKRIIAEVFQEFEARAAQENP